MATGWMVQGSNPGKDKRFFCFRKRPGRLWGPSRVLLNEQRGSFQREKQPGREINKSAPSSA